MVNLPRDHFHLITRAGNGTLKAARALLSTCEQVNQQVN